MKKKVLWTVVIICAAAALWTSRSFFGGKAVPEKAASEKAGEGDGLEQKILSFTIDGRSPKGVKQWHLEGTSAEIKGEAIHLNDLVAVAYGDDATVNLTSDSGIYAKEKGEVELIGNVKVVSDSGFTLTTEKAKWSQLTKEISTDDIVHITGEGMKAVGKGGTANSDEKTATLNKDVSVEMEPDTKVDCKGSLQVDYSKNIAVFHEDVEVEDKDGRLFSDKLTVEFDPETKKLAQVTAEGNVKVWRGKSYTISEKAIYTESTKSAKLLGRPRMIIDPTELSDLDRMSKKEDSHPGGEETASGAQ